MQYLLASDGLALILSSLLPLVPAAVHQVQPSQYYLNHYEVDRLIADQSQNTSSQLVIAVEVN